jgi:DNA invertase Pin-like site-specific DNA recombinase
MTRRRAIGYSGADRSDAARKALGDFCRDRDLELSAVITDEQGLGQAIDAACRAGSVLVADRLATVAASMLDAVRLCRQLRESHGDLALLAEGVNTSDAAQGDVIFRVMDALAELEYRRLADRLPYGYVVADDLEHIRLHPEQANVIRRIVRSSFAGRTDQQIADELNGEGVAGRQGAAWDAQAVKRVVDHAPTSRWPIDDDDTDAAER